MIVSREYIKELIAKVMTNTYYSLNSNTHFKSGDTYSAHVVLSGYISNAGKNLHLALTLPKSLKNISSITINTLTGDIRASKSYIGTSASSSQTINFLSGATSNISKMDNYNVRLIIAKSSAYTNGTSVNNSNIGFIGTIKLTFT